MQVFDGQEKASEVIASYRFIERWHLSDHLEHLFTADVLHQQEDIFLIVECFDKANNIRKYCLLEDLFLLNYT